MKNSNSIALAIAVFVLFATACTPKVGSDISEFQLNQPFELSIGKSAKQEPGRLKLTFSNVTEDSRCPEGLNCMWEGRVTTSIIAATSDGSQTFSISREGTPKNPPAVKFQGYTIRLLDVAPYPKKDVKIDKQSYAVKLSVGKE